MPRIPAHTLVWSEELRLYEHYTRGRRERSVRPADDADWQGWLALAGSFAFHGASGSLNVYQEARPRGGRYWYAYHTVGRRTRKRYLGSSAGITLARLEETAGSLAGETAASVPAGADAGPPAVQHFPILASSLAPPHLPHAVVERQRLLALLDGALSTPLVLLSAAAGWGKTTVLTAWASRRAGPVAWLSLSEPDMSVARFWAALIAALRRSDAYAPGMGDTAAALLQSPQPPPLSACVSALLRDLDRCTANQGPVVLIVDDYHVLGDPVVHEGMGFFLEHLPAHLHVIVSSRIDPPLPLARWRVRGQLTEIRAADLRFELDEAQRLLGALLSPPLADHEVHVLVQRTEGWAAGLHLAALAARQRMDRAAFVQALTGSQGYLLDYVQEEILSRLPPDARDFLLQTAVVTPLDAPLCQAVTAQCTSAISRQMLTLLERGNLFLVPLDEQRVVYRLHDLFREALLAVLHATQPEMVPILHHRAADYYVAAGQWPDAIGHAIAATEYGLAARLLAQTAEQFWLRGEAARMANWVLALPHWLVREHAQLVLTTALHLLNTVAQTTQEQRARVQQQARQLMARVEGALLPVVGDAGDRHTTAPAAALGDVRVDEQAPRPDEALLRRRLRLLHLFLVGSDATAHGDLERLRSLEPEIEEELDAEDEPLWKMVPLAHSFVLHFAVRGEGARLLPRLLDAKERAHRAGSRYATLKVMQWLALAALQAGQLRLAYRESLAALDLIEQVAGYALLTGYFELVLAQVLYQWNRLEEAQARLHAVLQAATAWHAWQQVDLLGAGYIELLHVALAKRDETLARQALGEVEQLVERERFGHHPGWLPAVRAEWWLSQGRVEEAAAWAVDADFPVVTWVGAAHAAFRVVIRVYFAQRRWREAVIRLEQWRDRLDRSLASEDTIAFLAQSLVARYHAGDEEQARAVAARLLALTRDEGHRRVFLDEGEPMRQALLALHPSRAACESQDPTARTHVAAVLAAFPQQEPATTISLPRAAASSAALTRREREVLHLLATGASNQEIATTLVIELSTVKKHVSNLLGKLGARSRTQVAIRARDLALF